MDSLYPFLDVTKPDGDTYTIAINKQHLTIGRKEDNDIVLPDPEKTISRLHCVIEKEGNAWWIVDDNPSANGTFIQRNHSEPIDVRRHGKLKLNHGDIILILGQLLENDEPVFWRLKFRDLTDKTNPIPTFLTYSLSQQQLFRRNGGGEEKIHLTPKERLLIHYMAAKNQQHNQQMRCEYSELVKAIWNEEFGKNNNDVIHLVWSVRKKIEKDSGEPEFLQTEQGGYSLKVKVQP
ncbi:MAG: FHA domain-containing protein [Nostocaceae cyanobacterium]|nr:FHA domain-containing protein [Nostocaceae cyanobacterium]